MGWRERVERVRVGPEAGERVKHTTSRMTGILMASTSGLQFDSQVWIRVLRHGDGRKVNVPYSTIVLREELQVMTDLELLADESIE